MSSIPFRVPGEETAKARAAQVARAMKIQYEALLAEGFDEEQAMDILYMLCLEGE